MSVVRAGLSTAIFPSRYGSEARPNERIHFVRAEIYATIPNAVSAMKEHVNSFKTVQPNKCF